jgi:hypothetical protein
VWRCIEDKKEFAEAPKPRGLKADGVELGIEPAYIIADLTKQSNFAISIGTSPGPAREQRAGRDTPCNKPLQSDCHISV